MIEIPLFFALGAIVSAFLLGFMTGHDAASTQDDDIYDAEKK